MERHRCRLLLEARPRVAHRDRCELLAQPIAAQFGRRVDLEGVVDVELGAVAADEVDLARQAAQHRQVPQGARADDTHVGLVERCEVAQCDNRLPGGHRPHRIAHDRRDRPVVVGRHEELWHLRDLRDPVVQLGGEQRLGRRHVANRSGTGNETGACHD